MNSFNDTNVSEQGREFANKAADKAQDGINKAASTASDTVESARQQSKRVIDKVGTKAGQVRDSAIDASDSVITYTKDNPVKALLIAAAAGACFLTVMRALTPSRR